MQKSNRQLQPHEGRILARCLAEDLRNVCATKGQHLIGKATSTLTSPNELGGRKDITNMGSDGDVV
jgi:hypothetical protein